MKLLLATTNQGKAREYRHLLQNLYFELVTPADLGIEEKPEETGKTLEENALLKANFYFTKAGIPVLADDTGLEIYALGGEPGIHARRWPGHEAGDQELIDYTLQRLEGVPEEKRTARFRAVVAVAKGRDDIRLFDGVMEGYIAEKPHYPIVPGYPYRSLFSLKQGGRVLSEFTIEELENMHRKRAIDKAMPFLRSLI
jgi:XTP/dITP diphosphohydrolase